MHGTLPKGAKSLHVQSDTRTGQMVSDDENDWFVSIVRQLIGKNAGLALSIVTGEEERTCYRYANGDRKPPGYFIRALLRSEQGATWLAALMDGSDAQWWRELQAARELCIKFKIEQR